MTEPGEEANDVIGEVAVLLSARRKKNVRGALHSPHPRHLQFSHTFIILSCVRLTKYTFFTNPVKMSKPFDPEQAENLEDVRCQS